MVNPVGSLNTQPPPGNCNREQDDHNDNVFNGVFDRNVTSPIFVVGLAKTGTACLKDALEQIRGVGTCLHLDDFFNSAQIDLDAWIQVVLERDAGKRQLGLRRLLQGYNMASGVPITSMISDLLKLYPTAKFILTVRSAEIWLATCRSTIIPKHPDHMQQTLLHMLSEQLGFGKLEKLHQLILRQTLGESTDFSDDDQLLKAYVQWNDRIERLIPKERLLVFHVRQGWSPLCTFLNEPIPNTPFPKFRHQTQLINWNKSNVSYVKHLIVCCSAYALFGIAAFNLTR
ncbi:hypothetical protein D915_001029 [Fasciola hepatica]|uniref:Uncharacterized protein n=1 Tax=Fasciola hepatica TaxID=6192 RepID=A0A4E0RJ24_FASHE|nr:hypothetical protein D915_001029 [Fasciola hepatica]